MGLRLIRNHAIVNGPVIAGLGAPLFPDFGRAAQKADVDFAQDVSERGAELFQEAYREGYASGYALSWAIQRRRTIPLLRALDRLAGDVKEHVRRERRNVEDRTHEIANAIAASLVANEAVVEMTREHHIDVRADDDVSELNAQSPTDQISPAGANATGNRKESSSHVEP